MIYDEITKRVEAKEDMDDGLYDAQHAEPAEVSYDFEIYYDFEFVYDYEAVKVRLIWDDGHVGGRELGRERGHGEAG